MLNTIEDKLSAIKAINDEIAQIEESLSNIAFMKSTNGFTGIIFDKVRGPISFNLPPAVLNGIADTVHNWLCYRKQELTDLAKELMK